MPTADAGGKPQDDQRRCFAMFDRRLKTCVPTFVSWVGIATCGACQSGPGDEGVEGVSTRFTGCCLTLAVCALNSINGISRDVGEGGSFHLV